MALQEDVIVDIPENRVKYFGTTGKMLLPCPQTVAALIQKIPVHKVITTNLLQKILTKQFNVQGTCPVTTRTALQAIAADREQTETVAYWRVVNKNGGLISNFPGAVEQQAVQLRQEGFVIDTSGKTLKVKNFLANLADLV